VYQIKEVNNKNKFYIVIENKIREKRAFLLQNLWLQIQSVW